MTSFNPNIFREYDIRGHAERDLSNDLSRDLGRAYGTYVGRAGGRNITISRDCRLSSPRLHEAFVDGILSTGLSVVDIGVGPTPLLYFAVFHEESDGGVQITGSHNPGGDNGYKMMRGRHTLAGFEIQALRKLIETRDFVTTTRGRHVERSMLPPYTSFMRANFAFARTDIGFAIDAGNGAGGPLAVAAMRAVGLSPQAILCEMDGNFPVHHPDPSLPENLELLASNVREKKYELGIAYDGDADRIGVVDERGVPLYGDRLLILFAREVLKSRPAAAIIGEVKCSDVLYEDIARKGGRPVMWKTGHSLIKKKMQEEGALLAGEMSGHMFFADRYYGFDDAIYASLRLLEIVANSRKTLTELLVDVPKTHSTPELRVECSDETKFDIVQRVLAHYQPTHDVVDVDGARIKFDGGWGLVRASNTQPVLVLRFEAETESRLAEIRGDVEAVVKKYGGSVTAAAH